MHIGTLVEMVESGLGERLLVGTAAAGLTGEQLARRARGAGADLRGTCTSLVYAGENHRLLPVAMLGASWAGVPFVPVNYRLEDHQLIELIGRQPGCKVVADASTGARLRAHHVGAVLFDEWLTSLSERDAVEAPEDDDDIAIVLYTSGTTAAPKAALLRHRHMMAYLLGTVEYASAGEDEAVLVSVPPYHIAGMANMLSNLFAGRRLVYLDHFDAGTWLSVAHDERVTHAVVVPTMLSRIVDAIDASGGTPPPTLRSLSYGGSKISARVLERALELFPTAGFVNAYGLTETASTIAVLGPHDHRAETEHRPEASSMSIGGTERHRPRPDLTPAAHRERTPRSGRYRVVEHRSGRLNRNLCRYGVGRQPRRGSGDRRGAGHSLARRPRP